MNAILPNAAQIEVPTTDDDSNMDFTVTTCAGCGGRHGLPHMVVDCLQELANRIGPKR